MNNTKNNINISTSINESNNTYFVHIKKNQFINLNDIDMIKELLSNNYDINISNSDELKFVNNNDINKLSYKKIGKYLKSNKNSLCKHCNNEIIAGSIYKQLDCKHRFHINCIDPFLKKDLYKKCTCCNTENISSYC